MTTSCVVVVTIGSSVVVVAEGVVVILDGADVV